MTFCTDCDPMLQFMQDRLGPNDTVVHCLHLQCAIRKANPLPDLDIGQIEQMCIRHNVALASDKSSMVGELVKEFLDALIFKANKIAPRLPVLRFFFFYGFIVATGETPKSFMFTFKACEDPDCAFCCGQDLTYDIDRPFCSLKLCTFAKKSA